MKGKIIIICGATGSGKSDLAIKLAKLLNTEIVSADSLAIYKNLDIGTAKPTKSELSEVKHHLIDVVEPFNTYSVSDYENMALPIVNELIENGKIPIICGGTGFYINSLLYKMSYGNTAENSSVREKYLKMYDEGFGDKVYEELVKVDFESSKKIHKNDAVRVVRALEIFYATGKKKSEQNDKLNCRFDYVAFTISHSRENLYNRINLRVDKMLELGLIDEVKKLIDLGLTKDNQCMQGIGYKEVAEGLRLGCTVGEMKDLIKKNTRNYAKRQETYFKRMENHTKVHPKEDMLAFVATLLNK